VCHYHGGAAPQVKQAALQGLRALQDPAIDRLAKLIDQDQFPSVSYAASQDVLDRTLGKAMESLEVRSMAVEELSDDELVAQVRALLARMDRAN
jgi:hypothetical protein